MFFQLVYSHFSSEGNQASSAQWGMNFNSQLDLFLIDICIYFIAASICYYFDKIAIFFWQKSTTTFSVDQSAWDYNAKRVDQYQANGRGQVFHFCFFLTGRISEEYAVLSIWGLCDSFCMFLLKQKCCQFSTLLLKGIWEISEKRLGGTCHLRPLAVICALIS